MPLARWLEASPTNATSPPSSDHPPPNSTSPPPRIPSAPRLPPQPTPPPPKPSDPSPSPPSNSSTPATPSSPPPKIPVTPTLPPRPLPSPPYSPPPSPPVTPTLPSRPLPSPPYSPPPSVPVTPSVPPPSNSTTPIMPLPPGTPGGSPPLIPTVPSPPAPRGGSPTVIPSPPSSENTPSDSDRSKIWISKGAIAGISIGAAAILVLLCLFFYNRKKKRSHHHCQDNSHDVKPRWQHNDASQGEVQPRPPAPPPPYASPHLPYPPPPLPPHVQFSSASGGNNSGSEPLTPNFAPPTPNFTPSYANSSFTYEELSVAANGFSEFNLLGQGGFGYVHRGVLPNGKEVAIKQLKAGSGQGEREFQAEVEIISRVHHRHLVSLVGYCISGYHRLLVYEYVPNKTLEFHLHAKNVPPMDWPTRLKIALASAKGLAYLHEDCRPKIIHRDIKAANILLELNFDAKVADFGLAKPNTENNTHVSTRVMGTFGYLAPEYASSGKLTEKSDVFSFGVMLLEIITGKRPVDSIQFYGYDSLVDWARPLLSKAMKDDDYVDLIDPKLGDNYNKDEIARMVACAASCVRHSARRRPMMSKIVRALEGDVSLNDLNDGIRPGQCSLYGSTDYDKMQYEEDMRKFRNLALSSTDEASSEYTVPTASGSESGKRQETQS